MKKRTKRTRRAADKADDDLLRRAREALDTGDYSSAIRDLRGRLTQPLPTPNRARGILLGNLGANLIDLGSEGGDIEAVQEAVSLYQSQQNLIRESLGAETFHYNLANGLKTLADSERVERRAWNLDLARLLTASKNHYWQAVRSSRAPRPELLVNLANVLSASGRVSEALYWYDRALALNPSHPMAHGNRSDCLRWLAILSSTHSLSMIMQIAQGYRTAVASPLARHETKQTWAVALEEATEYLARHGTTLEEIEADHTETADEEREHSDYRRFCIRQSLMIAEHALYCPCAGARRDSLSITLESGLVGDYVPAMELLLNRLKAEFNLARLLFYQNGPPPTNSWTTEPFEGTYTELLDDAAIDVRSEMLRTSFRLCFGIFDRIAFGICSLFQLASPRESLFFHSLWNPPSKQQRSRWERLNELSEKYPSLVALYSQATDFSQRDGEWGHLRAYRNYLEHELMVMGPEDRRSLGPFASDRYFKDLATVSAETFRTETLHLLRFTASGILSFALLVRQVARLESLGRAGGPSIVLSKKSLGPP